MAKFPQFVNADGEVITPMSADEAANLRRAGVPEATTKHITEDNFKKQYSSDWTNHPLLTALGAVEAGALGVAKSIPGLTTAATGYTQLADLAMDQVGAKGSITSTFHDYMKAEAETHPIMDAAGQVAGAAVAGVSGNALLGGYSPVSAVLTGSAQGFGQALDQAAMDHVLTPSGAEKVGMLMAQLTLGAVLGGVAAKGSDVVARFATDGGLGKLGAGLVKKGTEIVKDAGAPGAVSKFAGTVAKASAGAAATSTVLGIHGVAVPALGVAGVAKAVQKATDPKTVGKAISGLGKAINGVDTLVAKALQAGLYEDAFVGATTGLLTHESYQQVATAIANMEARPTEMVPTLSANLAAQGVPGELADIAVQQNARAIAYLAGERPKPAFGAMDSVAPVQQAVPLAQKAAFMDKVNTVQNPTWALQNPNPTRMAALRAVYPVLVNAVSGLTAQETALQPGLGLKGRQWAAQVTGRPATPMASPRLQALQQMMDQSAAQRRAAPTGPARQTGTLTASNDTSMVDSTQAERLAR